MCFCFHDIISYHDYQYLKSFQYQLCYWIRMDIPLHFALANIHMSSAGLFFVSVMLSLRLNTLSDNSICTKHMMLSEIYTSEFLYLKEEQIDHITLARYYLIFMK